MRGSDASTYIVVLDGEQDEPVGVLLQQRLVCLFLLDGSRSGGLCRRGLLDDIRYADNGLVHVLLLGR